MSKPIKDLKDLSILRDRACYRHSGPTDLKSTRDVFFRSANDGEGNPLASACGMRGPKPYDEGGPSAAAPPVGATTQLHRDQEVSPTGKALL